MIEAYVPEYDDYTTVSIPIRTWEESIGGYRLVLGESNKTYPFSMFKNGTEFSLYRLRVPISTYTIRCDHIQPILDGKIYNMTPPNRYEWQTSIEDYENTISLAATHISSERGRSYHP